VDKTEFATWAIERLSVQQSVREGLQPLNANEMEVIPGRLNRVMNLVTPGLMKRRVNGKKLKSGNGL
jgi:type VI protein secretion system component Hcp